MSHYFSSIQESKITEKRFFINIFNKEFEFILPSGVFASKKLDRGSEVLILYSKITKNDLILDLGCGWGPIGIILGLEYKCFVDMVDTNKRAIKYSKINAKKNKIKVHAFESDIYSKIDKKYDVILCNLPQSAGMIVCKKIITESINYLKDSGSLQVVIRRNKGGRVIEELLEEVYGNVEVLAKKSGYWVYYSVK